MVTTIKKTVDIVNNRIMPSDKQLDAALLELSTYPGNLLTVREDGLYVPSVGGNGGNGVVIVTYDVTDDNNKDLEGNYILPDGVNDGMYLHVVGGDCELLGKELREGDYFLLYNGLQEGIIISKYGIGGDSSGIRVVEYDPLDEDNYEAGDAISYNLLTGSTFEDDVLSSIGDVFDVYVNPNLTALYIGLNVPYTGYSLRFSVDIGDIKDYHYFVLTLNDGSTSNTFLDVLTGVPIDYDFLCFGVAKVDGAFQGLITSSDGPLEVDLTGVFELTFELVDGFLYIKSGDVILGEKAVPSVTTLNIVEYDVAQTGSFSNLHLVGFSDNFEVEKDYVLPIDVKDGDYLKILGSCNLLGYELRNGDYLILYSDKSKGVIIMVRS